MRNGKRVLITGATSGVGYALTIRLLAEGYDVIATGRSEQALEELKEKGAEVVKADLTDPEQLDALVRTISVPDIVILSAGVGTFSHASTISDEAVDNMFTVNVAAPIKLVRRFAKGMMTRKSGHIIFIGSQAGKVATPKASVYAATKHAIIGYSNALRMELAPYGINVSAIHPGPIDTPFIDLADDTGSYRKSLGKFLLSVDDVVNAVIRVIQKPVREVNLPWYMGISSKLYGLSPSLIERLGKKFFMKK